MFIVFGIVVFQTIYSSKLANSFSARMIILEGKIKFQLKVLWLKMITAIMMNEKPMRLRVYVFRSGTGSSKVVNKTISHVVTSKEYIYIDQNSWIISWWKKERYKIRQVTGYMHVSIRSSHHFGEEWIVHEKWETLQINLLTLGSFPEIPCNNRSGKSSKSIKCQTLFKRGRSEQVFKR